jgi:hypothetical protein
MKISKEFSKSLNVNSFYGHKLRIAICEPRLIYRPCVFTFVSQRLYTKQVFTYGIFPLFNII